MSQARADALLLCRHVTARLTTKAFTKNTTLSVGRLEGSAEVCGAPVSRPCQREHS